MRRLLLIAAFMSLGFSTSVSGQASDPSLAETSGDAFSEAVSDYIEGEVKKKLRADAAKKALEKVGNETLKSLAAKLKITSFSPKNPYFVAFMLTFTPKPLNEGEEESLREVLKDYWPYPKPQRKPDYAVQNLINEAISYACEGRGGNMASRNIFVQDLDGDGREDLILDHAGITCSSGRPISCGAQVCATHLFMRRGDLLKKELDLLGTVTSISTDPAPIITFYMHGGGTPSLRWDGRGFAMR